MDMIASLLIPLVSAAAGGFGAYLGIRVDLARHATKIEHIEGKLDNLAESDNSIHARIDRLLERFTK